MGHMTQPTVSQHRRTMVSQPGQGPIPPGTILLILPFLQTNITSQMGAKWSQGGGGLRKVENKQVENKADDVESSVGPNKKNAKGGGLFVY